MRDLNHDTGEQCNRALTKSMMLLAMLNVQKKFKKGSISELEIMNEHVDDLREVCEWAPADGWACPSSEILSSPEAISFIKKHVRKGTHKLELFRVPSCGCKFCKTTAKIDVRCIGHVQYPLLKYDGTYSLPDEYLPVGSPLEEKDCPSKSGKHRVEMHPPKKNRINDSTTLDAVMCHACCKDRSVCGSRKHVSTEQIKHIEDTHVPDYQC